MEEVQFIMILRGFYWDKGTNEMVFYQPITDHCGRGIIAIPKHGCCWGLIDGDGYG